MVFLHSCQLLTVRESPLSAHSHTHLGAILAAGLLYNCYCDCWSSGSPHFLHTNAWCIYPLQDCGLADVSLLLSFPHLQRVNLSSNSLTGEPILFKHTPYTLSILHTHTHLHTLDVSVLSNLPYLTFLDLSSNKLSTVLDFEPPHNLAVLILYNIITWLQYST